MDHRDHFIMTRSHERPAPHKFAYLHGLDLRLPPLVHLGHHRTRHLPLPVPQLATPGLRLLVSVQVYQTMSSGVQGSPEGVHSYRW
jgi:hypothetical protein